MLSILDRKGGKVCMSLTLKRNKAGQLNWLKCDSVHWGLGSFADLVPGVSLPAILCFCSLKPDCFQCHAIFEVKTFSHCSTLYRILDLRRK